MSVLDDFGGWVSSAAGWVGKQAKVIPGVGSVLAGAGASVQALLEGGSVTTTYPDETGSVTQSFGATLPPKTQTPVGMLLGSKIAGVPFVPALLILLLLIGVRIKKGKR